MFVLELAGDFYTCGNLDVELGAIVINLIHTLYLAIQVGVPLLLIFFGMLDLGKAVMAQKEDEIKKGQQMFVKRLITAGLVFLVFTLVRTALGLVNVDDGVIDCANCLIKADDTYCDVVDAE